MVKFLYLQLSLGFQTVSFRFLQRLAKARMDVNVMPAKVTKKIFRLVFPEKTCLISSSQLYRSILGTSKDTTLRL